MEEKWTLDYAEKLDEKDVLSGYKEEFYLPEHLYYEANGLGPMSKRSEATMKRVASEWKDLLVAGWFAGEIPWFYYPERLAGMEQELVGAVDGEVIINGTTTTNIHCVLSAFYQPRGKRTKILCDSQIFSTDKYAVDAQVRLKGLDPEQEVILGGGDGLILDEKKIVEEMTSEVALVFLGSVIHTTGQLLDVEYLTEEAHKRGIQIGFDLSHSAGVVPHKLHEWGVDFAVWCNYKYLNGGLGCPASLFIHEAHFDMEPALPGWHGFRKAKQFQKLPRFEAETGAGGWQHGSPLILNMAPLEGALDMVREAGIERIRRKSLDMTGYLMDLIEERLVDLGTEIVTPREESRRGGHVTILHAASEEITEFLDNGSQLTEELREKIMKRRRAGEKPGKKNQVRIAFSPLFSSFADVWQTAENLYQLLKER